MPSDSIGILAPARKLNRKEMAPSLKLIKEWGYEAVEGKYLYGAQDQYSGSDEERACDFQQMLDDDSIKAIFCARGGYGSVRIIDQLDFSLFLENPKWIVGYSDISVFHSHINRHYGIQTLHATMPINFPVDGKPNNSVDTLKAILEGWLPEYHLKSHPLNRAGSAIGVV